ncbi:hypothetical protein R6Q59_028701 [Mikania micrantha]
MGETMMSNTINQRFLTFVKTTTDVKNLNWCDYMMICLKTTREAWNSKQDDLYNDPILLLVVLHIYQKEKSKAKWCKEPNKLHEINFNKLQEYE